MTDLRTVQPGSNIDLVVNVDFAREVIDVRRSLVYDIIEKRIVLSQTNPPVTNKHIGKKFAITYLAKKDDDRVRYGFYGKVMEVLREYELSSSDTVMAIAIDQETDPAEFNVRMYFRVKPGRDSNVSLSIKGEKVNIVDISIGGAKITHLKELHIEPLTTIRGILSMDGEDFDVKTKVLRVWEPPGSKKADNLEFMAVKFLDLNKELEDILGKKISQIERATRFKEMFP
jgi:hypothetical protein